MQYLDDKLDVIANNLANIETNGYKRSGIAFHQHMVAEQAKHRNQITTDPLPQGQIKTYIETSQGVVKHTGNPLNFALEGEGYFAIQTPEGFAWTRDGAFTMNEEGYLTTMEGYHVLGEYNGPIRLNGKSFSVSDKGDIVVDNQVQNRFLVQYFDINEVYRGAKNIYYPVNYNEMVFIEPDVHNAGLAWDQQHLRIDKAKISQGFLEGSNVSIVKEMVTMIAVNRQYAAQEKAIRAHDEALNKAVNNIAR
jgi:flagellar basal-body rod protein FlgG